MPVSETAKPIRLHPAPFSYTRYFVPVAPGVTLEDVLASEFWVHVAKALRVHDVAEIVALDGSFEADLRLVAKGTSLKWRIIREYRAEVAEAIEQPAAAARFETKHVGKGVYNVVDKLTGSPVSEGHDKAGAEEVRVKLEAERQAS